MNESKKVFSTLNKVYKLAIKHTQITTILVQRELRLPYSLTWRTLDALIILGLLKKEGAHGHFVYNLEKGAKSKKHECI